MTKVNKHELALKAVYNAYQMYTSKPSNLQDDPYEMYSFDRPSRLFWTGVANTLAEHGYDYDNIKVFLSSKDTRWMLDQFEDQVESLGKELAKKYLEANV